MICKILLKVVIMPSYCACPLCKQWKHYLTEMTSQIIHNDVCTRMDDTQTSDFRIVMHVTRAFIAHYVPRSVCKRSIMRLLCTKRSAIRLLDS